MKELPKRDDDIYKDIENFRSYELINNVAYEMAIRAGVGEDEYLFPFLLNKLFFRPRRTREVYIYNSLTLEDVMDKVFPYSPENLLNKLKSEGTEDKFIDKYTNLEYMIKMFINNEDEEFIDYTLEDGTILSRGRLQYILRRAHIPKHVFLGLSRPRMKAPSMLNIEFNLDLPIEENIEVLKKIKSEYDSNRSSAIFKPLDVYNQNFSEIEIFKNRASTWADIFYIYDCLKVGMTQRKIQNEVYNYYSDQNIETRTLDPKTIKKYRDIANDYIDNMRYKELIRGVKS